MRLADRFDLIERIAVGGSASIYRANDSERDDLAAVKVLHDEVAAEPLLIERFEREAQILSQLDHPCFPRFRARSSPGEPLQWFAQDFIQGKDLAVLSQAGLDLPQLVGCAIEICEALAYLHDRGIVHRDIKPANILIDAAGSARLVDFGIAQLPLRRDTVAHATLGTPTFMAPEQAVDPRVADARSDVYALGATIFSAATRLSPIELAYPQTRADALAEVPPALAAVLHTCTEPNPEARYDNAVTLQWDFAAVLETL